MNAQDTAYCQINGTKTLAIKYEEMQSNKDNLTEKQLFDRFCPYETDLKGVRTGNLRAQHSS